LSKNINEEKSLGILYANFQGKKRKINDWILIANQVKKLSDHYGSHKKLATYLDVSEELLRETLKLLELPKEVQELVRNNILKHEVAWRIASVKGEHNQIKIAKSMVGLATHDARNLVRLFRENPDINIEELKQMIKKSKTSVINYSFIIVPVKQIDQVYLKREANKKKTTPSKLISEEIIPKWLKEVKK